MGNHAIGARFIAHQQLLGLAVVLINANLLIATDWTAPVSHLKRKIILVASRFGDLLKPFTIRLALRLNAESMCMLAKRSAASR